MAARAYIGEFDPLRVLAAAAVVFIHAAATLMLSADAPSGWDPLFLLDMYVRFAVPAFVFMAAALSWAWPPERGVAAYLAFMGRRLRTLGPLYLAWSLAYWAVAVAGWGFEPPLTGTRAGLGALVTGILSGSTWSHLYFVPMVVVVYALTPVAARLMRWRTAAVLIVPVVVIAAWWLLAPLAEPGPWATLARRFVEVVPAAAAGAWYAAARERSGAGRLWAVPGWPLLLVGGLAVQTLFVTGTLASVPGPVATLAASLWPVPVTLGLAGACAALAGRMPRLAGAASALAPATYGVYLAHPALMVALYRATRAFGGRAVWTDARLLSVKWGLVMVASFGLVAAAGLVRDRVRGVRGVGNG